MNKRNFVWFQKKIGLGDKYQNSVAQSSVFLVWFYQTDEE